MKIERMVERGRRETRLGVRRGSIESILSEDDIRSLLRRNDEATGTGTEETGDDTDAVTTGDELEMEGKVEDEVAANEKLLNREEDLLLDKARTL